MMRFIDLVGMSFANLARRPMRTMLTVLAVVIGAMLVTLVVSIGNGLSGFVVDQFGLMVSEEVITVATVEISGFEGSGGAPHEVGISEVEITKPFTADDVEAIKAINGVEQVDYSVGISAEYISAEGSDKRYEVFADTGADYDIQIRELAAGNYFTEGDSGLCLISYDYLGVFGWADAESAIGQQVTITVGRLNPFDEATSDFTFTIAGVIQSTINSSEVLVTLEDGKEMARFYQDNMLLYTEAEPGFALQVKVTSEEVIDQVAADIKALGFYTITPAEILGQITAAFSVIQIALGAFGVIALLVASIGIVNTLIMTIYERTREIGVMKAVGATKATVRNLFTAEGAALGFLGGAIGGGIGWLLGQALNIIGGQTFLSDFPDFSLSAFPLWLIPGIIALTTAISLVAALYPANRAAGLDPVESLRYE